MVHVSRIHLLTDRDRAFHPNADPRNVAMIQRRHAFWVEIARLRGWDLALFDMAAGGSLAPLSGSTCWVDLPMLPRARYADVVARAKAAGAAHVLDTPEDVDPIVGLDRSYPILLRAGVPTPRTAFVPVDDALAAAIDSPAAVRARLTEAMYGALFDADINPHDGVFVRGYYSSAKSSNPELYFGNNQEDIEATVFEVIRRLRVALDVGGLALREHMDLERIELPAMAHERGATRVPFEIRLTVLDGHLIMASYHGPYDIFTDEPRRAVADALTARRAIVEEAVRAVAPALKAADLSANYVADLAFPRGSAPVILELNPLYAAGYNVPAAHAVIVAALGAHLAYRAGYERSSWSEIIDTASTLMGEVVGESPGIWLFPHD